MKKLFNITMMILYTIIGLLVMLAVVILLIGKFNPLDTGPSAQEQESDLSQMEAGAEESDGGHMETAPVQQNLSEENEDTFSWYEDINSYEVSGTFDESIDTSEEWVKVIQDYFTAMINDRNREKASAYTDSSYYDSGTADTEEVRMSRINDLAAYQEEAILNAENLEQSVQTGALDYYVMSYIVYEVNKYNDDNGSSWVDAHLMLSVVSSTGGVEETKVEYYRISLCQYPEGWKVAWFAKA